MPLFSRHKDTDFTAPEISELPGRDATDEIQEPAPPEAFDAVWETPAPADEERESRRWGFLGSLFRRRKNDDVAVVVDPVYALPEPQGGGDEPFVSTVEPAATEESFDAGSDNGGDDPVYRESVQSESFASAEPASPEGSSHAGSANGDEGTVSYAEPLHAGSDEDTPDLSSAGDEPEGFSPAPGLRSVLAQRMSSAAYRTKQFFRRPRATVSIDGDVVRIVIFKGPEVIAWGAAQPEDYGDDEVPGSDELVGLAPAEEVVSPEQAQDSAAQPGSSGGATAEEPAPETTEDDGPEVRVRTLLNHLGFRRGRLVVDLPLHAPLARRLHLTKIRRGYHDQVVTAEALESIPFAEHEIDLTWQTRKNGAEEEVHAVAISKQAIDSRVRLLAEAGVRPRAAYSKAIALAHAANLRDAIVAHVTPTHASFVLVRGCVAEVIHQIELGARLLDPQRQAEAMSRAVESVAGFGHSVSPSLDLGSVPVVLVGQLPADGQLTEELRRTLRRPLSEFSPPISYPEHFSPAEYATNVGLAMADRVAGKPREKIAADATPAVNLLPARHLPKPLPVKPAAVLGGLLLLAGLAFAVDGRVAGLTSESAVLSADLAIIERQERQQKLGLARAEKIEGETAATREKAVAVSGHIASLGNKTRFLLTGLEAITHDALHPDVSLSSLKTTAGGFQIVGTGLGYDEVIQYAQTLRELDLFSSVRLHSTSDAQNGISFQLDITSAPRG